MSNDVCDHGWLTENSTCEYRMGCHGEHLGGDGLMRREDDVLGGGVR